jgi:hypothetical protein
MIHPYHESLLSQLHPGLQHSSNCLLPAVSTFEAMLPLPPERRPKVIWRMDRGFGGDDNVNWLLDRNYGILVKGCSNRRAHALAQIVKRWRAVRSDKFVAQVPTPSGFVKPLQTFALRFDTAKGWKYTYLLSTLTQSATATARLYDQRGGAETEFRSDKSGGLYLHQRRKHKRDSQEAWLLLTDVAHNCLSALARTIFVATPFEHFGFLRITRDLFSIPGSIEMENGRLLSVKLLKSSPFASDLLACLRRFWE